MSTTKVTAKDLVDHWLDQLDAFFQYVEATAIPNGWNISRGTTEISEDPFGLGASIPYTAPVLTLRRLQNGSEQRITFEPRHRMTFGAAGRIDVYSYPTLREAMLLRTPNTVGAASLTLEEAENLVANAPWRAFSLERLPLSVEMADPNSLSQFLEDLVA